VPKKAISLQHALRGEFGETIAVTIVPPPKGKYGCFEVYVGHRLVHSKLNGQGKVDTEEELDSLIGTIEADLERRRTKPARVPAPTSSKRNAAEDTMLGWKMEEGYGARDEALSA